MALFSAKVGVTTISAVLTNVKGNKTQAAKILGIDRKMLKSKLKKIKDTSHDE
ncbi:MAG: hypothetical protein KKE44_00050 [Proteobacteria bacterium]|nr:hypothetical protein [Pseudomonadota bacterium]MBU1581118.1 hypothetical protein [Pseudomonadota bacterium]MBU2628712.1 hypothetical protein [Pseudomonadota bacterium]